MRSDEEGGRPAERGEAGWAPEGPRLRGPHSQHPGEEGYGDDRDKRDPGAIRAEDTEPYVGLQYIARLFKIVAMIVVVALVAEIVAGLYYEGAAALLPLTSEVIQGGVLAAMLWGVGDLTLLFIDVGHDMRAARVLLGRLSARLGSAEYRRERGGAEGGPSSPPPPPPPAPRPPEPPR